MILPWSDRSKLPQAFPSTEYYVPPTQEIKNEILREYGQFKIIQMMTAFKADFYPAKRDEQTMWTFEHRRHATHEGERVVMAPPEDVIVHKLLFVRAGQRSTYATSAPCWRFPAIPWLGLFSSGSSRSINYRMNGKKWLRVKAPQSTRCAANDTDSTKAHEIIGI